MTAHPTTDNHDHWWLCCGHWRRLHAIPGNTITPADMRQAIDRAEPLPARAACGRLRQWQMPGIGSRLGLRRCTPCCQALGIPPGAGTPANATDLREAAC